MSANHSDFFRQKTIAREVGISGVGVHTGEEIHLRLKPAAAGTGVVFRRLDCGGVEIPALASQVSSLELATTLGRDDVTISTVEHLLAAIRMRDVDNLLVEIDGNEVPILDGSARPFAQLLDAAGRVDQDATRRILAVTAPLEVEMGGKYLRLSPFPGLRVSYALDYGHPSIGHQEVDFVIDCETFDRELAPARTFGLMSDVDQMRRRGLGLGGQPDNCVIFDDDGPMTALRFADEPVRHKALDAIGDLSLVGAPLWAHIEVERGGHQLHFSGIEALRKRPDCWTWLYGEPREGQLPATDGALERFAPPALRSVAQA